jgi:hypothetical protein
VPFGLHSVLTPIDGNSGCGFSTACFVLTDGFRLSFKYSSLDLVVKTKVQTDPIKYPGVIRSFGTVWKEEGTKGFLQGWAPTFVGFFVWGGVSYAPTELIRRTLPESPGPAAGGYEVPIILGAAAVGAFTGSFILCPFESVRIRSVSQPDYAPPGILVVSNYSPVYSPSCSLFALARQRNTYDSW